MYHSSLNTHCPICDSRDFVDFNGRTRVRCAKCHSMERTRLMFAAMQRTNALWQGMNILHFAPESGLGARLRKLAGRYVPADIDVSQYAKQFPEAERIDLCSDDLSRFAGQFDLVVHSHVLEHLPCSVGQVLRNMAACLKPNGTMFFAVPIRKNAKSIEEDPSERLSGDERKRRFGQFDHVRIFGDQDVKTIFRSALGSRVDVFPMTEHFTEEEAAILAIPHETGPTGHSTFIFSDRLIAKNLARQRRNPGEKIFFIGFNKAATTSLHKLMLHSGISSRHWDWGQLASDIEERIADKVSLKSYLSGATAYSDIVRLTDKIHIEGNRHFRVFEELFPDAYFILNDRNVDDWIRSRLHHNDGTFLIQSMKCFGTDEQGTIAIWREAYEKHRKAVLAHFAGSSRFLHFDVKKHPIENLIEFLSPSYVIAHEGWARHNPTLSGVSTLTSRNSFGRPAEIQPSS